MMAAATRVTRRRATDVSVSGQGAKLAGLLFCCAGLLCVGGYAEKKPASAPAPTVPAYKNPSLTVDERVADFVAAADP